MESLKQHSAKVSQLYQKIEGNKSAFHPSSATAEVNLKTAKELIAQVKEFNEILSKGIVSNK